MCFLSLVTLTFKRVRARDQTCLIHKQKQTNKKVTDSTKNSLTLCSLLCVVIMLLVDLNFDLSAEWVLFSGTVLLGLPWIMSH